MKNWIAERKLIAELKETGERKDFIIRIGMPYWDANEEFASCPLEWEGFFDRVADAKGIDLLQALQQASDIDFMLEYFREKYNFYWPSGEEYFDES